VAPPVFKSYSGQYNRQYKVLLIEELFTLQAPASP
jgi:hypothetical protein